MKLKESSGNQEVFLSLENIEDNTRRGIRQGFFRVGRVLRKDLRQELIKKNKTGRIYIRRTKTGRRRRHRASGPGQTPASFSGNYRRNIGFQIHGSENMQFGIRDGAPYAEFLEDGTSIMAARPGVGNTVKANQKNTQLLFESSISSELT